MPRPSIPVFVLASVIVARGASPTFAADGAEPLATVVVAAGETERIDTPVSVELPGTIDAWRPLRLVEVKGDERVPVPCQVEPSRPARLWWLLAGETPAGESRTYELMRQIPVVARAGDPYPEEGLGAGDAGAMGVELRLDPLALDVRVRDADLFRYNHAHVVPPEGVDPVFIRSGYIHPMYSPSGLLITEDFPSDHHHHKGIWMPWTHTTFKGHRVDFWNLGKREGTVQFAGFEGIQNGPVYGSFKARHEHVALKEGQVVLEETWDVRVWNVGGPEGDCRVWDLISVQTNVADSSLHLLEYHYGGLGYRGAREWKDERYEVLSSEGKTKKDGHRTRSKWCAHSGAIDDRWSTLVAMCHPSNERFPEGMRIWATGGAFFNYCPIQFADWEFEPGDSHTFRYRFFLHEGKIDAERAERAWRDFGDPPRARIEVAEDL